MPACAGIAAVLQRVLMATAGLPQPSTGLRWPLRPLEQEGCWEAPDEDAKRWSAQMQLPDAFWCVGSTPGKKPVNSGDVSDKDWYFFSYFSLAKINTRSETVYGSREVTDFKGCRGSGQLNWGGSEDGKWLREEGKVVCGRDSIFLLRWLHSPVI